MIQRFSKVILISNGFNIKPDDIETEKRLFYVAMTRAKEELIICAQAPNQFIQESGLVAQITDYPVTEIPQLMYYFDLTPADVNLRHITTRNQQDKIKILRE